MRGPVGHGSQEGIEAVPQTDHAGPDCEPRIDRIADDAGRVVELPPVSLDSYLSERRPG